MIFGIIKERLRQGRRTMKFPAPGMLMPEGFHGRLALDPAACEEDCQDCAAVCPTGAITTAPLRVDYGKCLFCPACTAACAHGALRTTAEHRLAVRRREDLITAGGEAVLAHALDAKIRRLFGRSLKLRQVSAGGCSGCEAELNVANNVVIFDLSRFGIQFVAAPRHADGIVITGPVSLNMRQALLDTWAAIAAPRIAIAVGACAISGGSFAGSADVAGIPKEIPIDLYVPGCPPHPLIFMDGLLRLLGRID